MENVDRIVENDENGVPLPFPFPSLLGLSFLPYTSSSMETDISHPSLSPGPTRTNPKKENDPAVTTIPHRVITKLDDEIPLEVPLPENHSMHSHDSRRKKKTSNKNPKSPIKKLRQGLKSRHKKSKNGSALSSPTGVPDLDAQINSISSDLEMLKSEQAKLDDLVLQFNSNSKNGNDELEKQMIELDKHTTSLQKLVMKHLGALKEGKKRLVIVRDEEKKEASIAHERSNKSDSVKKQKKKKQFGLFKSSNDKKIKKGKSSRSLFSMESEHDGPPIEIITAPQTIHNSFSKAKSNSFIRVNDLDKSSTIKNFKTPKTLPEITVDSNLSTFDFFHLDSVDTPLIIESLVRLSLSCSLDGSDNHVIGEWKPMEETKKILSKRSKNHPNNNNNTNMKDNDWMEAHGKEILVWSNKFTHKQYGSDLPVVKARGIVQTSPRKLLELLLDSSRVKEYNKMSLGRTDSFVFQAGLESQSIFDGGVILGEMKIIRSLSKAPFVKHPIELISLLYARELNHLKDDIPREIRGFIVITRAVMEDEDTKNGKKNEKTSRSEMLLGVNLIRYIDDDVEDENCCRAEFTTVTQMFSPLIPMMVAKRIGLSSAANFIRDIQAIYAQATKRNR